MLKLSQKQTQNESSFIELQTKPVVISERALKTVASRASEEAVRWTTRLMAMHPAPAKVLLFLSLDEDEGAEGAVRQTALAMAQMQQATLLIDANATAPWLQESFGLSSGSGLSDVLASTAALAGTIQTSSSNPNLSLLPAGRLSGEKLLGSLPGFTTSLEYARSRYAYTLISCAPYMKAPEASLLARSVDGVVLVVRARKHTRTALTAFKRELDAVKANLSGMLFCE